MLSEECKQYLRSKSQIDKIGKNVIFSHTFADNFEKINCYRIFRLAALNDCVSTVIDSRPPKDSITSTRLKRTISIVRKLSRSVEAGSRTKLSRIDDIVGIRVICNSLQDVLDFSRILSKQKECRVKNYIENPQKTGYRAIHHIYKIPQKLPDGAQVDFSYEIQVRSYIQHRWALWTEACGEQTKEAKEVTNEIERKLLVFSEKIMEWEHRNSTRKQRQEVSSGGVRENTDAKGEFILAVVKRNARHASDIQIYKVSEIDSVVSELSYLENDPDTRDDVLLLGSNATQVKHELMLTHATYFRDVFPPDDIILHKDDLEIKYE